MKKPEIEIKKAKKLVENFENLSASDIKNIVIYLMGAINSKIFYLGQDFEHFEKDFLVLNQNNMIPEELAETYFSLKNLVKSNFKKADRKIVTVETWKNNAYLKKEYFEGVIEKTEKIMRSLE